MDPEQHRRLESVFLEAESLPPDEQRTFVERELADEPELRARVLSMLGTDVGVDSFVSFAKARPERIGPYEIVEEIGRGGMGAVFRALQPTTKRVVALKLLRTELLGEALVRRFTLEVEVLGQLQHPNIAQIYEGGNARLTSGTVPYFVMEFVPNAKPIDRFVLDQGLDPSETLRLFLQLCSAIEYAHHKGIIHRDLKPENVLVDAEAAESRPKVIDFGIARVADAGTPGTAMTTTGQIIGTFESMSPEQARGATDEIDIRTDVYALGVVLYKMLTGGPPIPTRSLPITDAIQAIVEQPPVPPSKRRTGVRVELDAIILMCLAKDKDRRYETVRALHEDVEAFLDGRTVRAKAPTTMDVLRMTVRRYRAVLIPASIVFIVALVAAIVSVRFGLLANEREAETRTQAAELARNAYQSNLGAAAAAIEAVETDQARRFLDAAPEELRGWEWDYLSSRVSREVAVFETRAPSGYRLDFDSAGERFVTTSATDSMVCVWSASTGELLQQLPVGAMPTWAEFDGPNAIFARHGAAGAVQMQRISLDGATHDTWASDAVRTNGWNGSAAAGGFLLEYLGTDSLNVYDLHTRRVVHTLPRRRNRTWSHFAPARGWVIMEGENPDGTWTVDVFDLAEETLIHTIPNIDFVLRQAEVGPSGRFLALGSGDGRLGVWDLDADTDPVYTLALKEAPYLLAFSDDGEMLAGLTMDGKLHWWDLESGEQRGILGGFEMNPIMLRIQPGTNVAYTLTETGTVQVWDLAPRSDVLAEHASFVYAVDAAPRGDLVFSGGWDGIVQRGGCLRWTDLETGEAIGSIGPPLITACAAVSSDGTQVLVALGAGSSKPFTESEVAAWPADDRALAAFDIVREASLARISMVTGGTRAVYTYAKRTSDGRDRSILSVAVDPAFQRAAIAWRPGGTSIIDLETGDVLHESSAGAPPPGGVRRAMGSTVAWSPDGRWIAAGQASHEIELWNADTYETMTVLPGHEQLVWSLAFDSTGERLVSASDDQSVKVWSVPDGTLLADLKGHGTAVLCATFHPDGSRIVSGGRGGKVCFWRTDPYELLLQLPLHDSYVYSMDWSPDGEHLLTASGDGTVGMWGQSRPRTRSTAAAERAAIVARVAPAIDAALSAGTRIEEVWRSMVVESGAPEREKNVVWQELLRRSIAARS